MGSKHIEALLRRKIGLHVESIGEGAFERAVNERMAACRVYSEDAYLGHLLDNPVELERLIEQVVVHESWFFREPASLEFLCARATSVTRSPTRPFRVLSIPCASGEEPYSIAIMLLASGLAPGTFEIHAVDISAPALETARRGLYSQHAFRGAVGEYAPYLDERASGMQVISHVRELVMFSQGNVLDPLLLQGMQFDAVFCRNLLIYLDADSRARVLHNLLRWLSDDGVLFTGHAESSIAIERGLRKLGETRCFAFEKPQVESPAERLRPLVPALSTPTPPKRENANVSTTASARPARADSPREPSARERPQRSAPTPPGREQLEEARKLADRGDLTAARACCEAYLSAFGSDAAAYCLLAIVKQAAGDLDGAVDAFTKSLYLDAEQLEALLLLSLLHERRGNADAAAALRNRAERVQRRRKV